MALLITASDTMYALCYLAYALAIAVFATRAAPDCPGAICPPCDPSTDTMCPSDVVAGYYAVGCFSEHGYVREPTPENPGGCEYLDQLLFPCTARLISSLLLDLSVQTKLPTLADCGAFCSTQSYRLMLYYLTMCECVGCACLLCCIASSDYLTVFCGL